ncbi:hypothetical protein B0H66DRAFT_608486 [Apodospora peruviana]|uniref:Glycosyltransferase n=1 Tax=Apodospora peruviana TaxID=516989 RepID=A0AAE0HT99_9PEZI|nr:hypothetical protein B0H66DRAFT_608486 [Apodospora peruviana]
MASQLEVERAEPTGHGDLSAFPASLIGKRILLCTESFGPVNGVSRTTLMLVDHLHANGAIVAVVAPHNHTRQNTFVPTKSPAVVTDLETSDEHPEVRIQGYPLPYNPELSIVYPVRLSTLYRRTFGSVPDLIYLASPASLGFQVMLQLRQQHPKNQVPIIANFQTDLSGYCTILFPPPLSDLAVYIFAGVQGFLFRHQSVKTIFYPSRFVRRYLEKNDVPDDKLHMLQRGVDTDLFNPGRRSEDLREQIAPGGEIILICVARLAAEKGFSFLAEVAKILDERRLGFKLFIVGGNWNAAVENEIKELFTNLVEKGKVVFAGFRVGESLAEAYSSADIFLHCSITETFGLVVLESMASGVPVVARDEGGPSDIVRNGKTGYLVPPDEVTAFADKVVILAEDTVLRKRFSEDARRQAEEATWERINNQVAWRMADTIAERDSETGIGSSGRQGDVSTQIMGTVPVFGWLFLNDALRARIVDARLVGGMAAISAAWVTVGGYLAFSKLRLWLNKRRVAKD